MLIVEFKSPGREVPATGFALIFFKLLINTLNVVAAFFNKFPLFRLVKVAIDIRAVFRKKSHNVVSSCKNQELTLSANNCSTEQIESEFGNIKPILLTF